MIKKLLFFFPIFLYSAIAFTQDYEIKINHKKDKHYVNLVKKGLSMLCFNVKQNDFKETDSLILAQKAEVSFYLGEGDSIYHPKLDIVINKVKKEVLLNASEGYENALFRDNHHKFYFNIYKLKYSIDKDSIDFYNNDLRFLQKSAFISYNYFDENDFNELSSGYSYHPLKLLNNFIINFKSPKNYFNWFEINELINYYEEDEPEIMKIIIFLHKNAFLDFDEDKNAIRATERLKHQIDAYTFFMNYDKEKGLDFVDIDYDNLKIKQIHSQSYEIIASLNRANAELIIKSIGSFYLSKISNAVIIPDSTKQEVTVYQGRSLFMPKGTITVGNFTFIGQQFFLLYDDFSLEMPVLDKILFQIDDTLQRKVYDYGREIKFGAGNMYINHPLNKSGRKKGKIAKNEEYNDLNIPENFEAYPKLNIPQGGEMFFQTSFRQNFAYDSLRAFFKIDPIGMDSINLKLPTFPGTFYSNMFPPIRDYLIPMRQPDLTMGFIHKAPKAGYPIYNGYNGEEGSEKLPHSHINNAKMKFSRDLIMNKDGLFSAGEISYLTTTIQTPEVYFMPDSVQADSIDFNVKSGKVGGAEFAEATGKKTQLRWLTSEDKMFITNKIEINKLKEAKAKMDESAFNKNYKEKLLTLYGSQNPMTLEGNITVTAEGLKGDGNLARKDFSVISESEEPFVFKMNKFDASNIQFRINSKERDPYAYDNGTFYAENKAILIGIFVDVEFDLVSGKAKIAKDKEFFNYASFELPDAQYRTSIKEVLWDFNKKKIYFYD